MRVLVISSTFPSRVQPTRGVFVRERIRRLSERCELVVVAPVPWFPFNRWIRRDRAAVPRVEQEEKYVVYHPRFLSFPRYGKWLDGILYFVCVLPFVLSLRRRFPFDVVDAHFVYPDGLAATLTARLLGLPVVVTLRGSIVRLSTYRLHRPQLRWTLRHADRLTAVSESLRLVAMGLGVPAERIRVIPNGVDTSRFVPMDRLEARRRAGLPSGATLLVTVAGIYEGKGQHLVVEALPSLLERYPNMVYAMVGSPRPGETYRRRLETWARRLGVYDRIYFAGPRPQDELAEWFSAADLSVLATRSEGWPNVVLESLACGTPVVATRVGGTEEILRHGQDGLLVPHGDIPALKEAILECLGRDWDRSALVKRACTFDWRDSVDLAFEELARAVGQSA